MANEEIEAIHNQLENLDTEIGNNKVYTTHLYDALIQLLSILHKATNTAEFEKIRQQLTQLKDEWRG